MQGSMSFHPIITPSIPLRGEFLILSTHCSLGRRGQYKRLFLTEDEYGPDAVTGMQGQLQTRRHAAIIEAHILPDKQKNAAIDGRRPIGGFKYGRL